MMAQKISHNVLLDTDALNPDVIKAGFAFVVDQIALRGDRTRTAIDWSTLEFAMRANTEGDETVLSARAAVLV